MASANIFQQYLQAPRSVVDYENDYAKADALKNQNAMQSLSLQQAANVQSQRNALRDLVQSGQVDLNDPTGLQRAVSLAPDVAPALAKTIQDQKTSAALAAKDSAQAGNFTADADKTNFATQMAKTNKQLSDIASFGNRRDALTSIQGHLQSGKITQEQALAAASGLPQTDDPAAFRQWQVNMLIHTLDNKDQVAQLTPKVDMQGVGGSVVPVNTNPNAGPVGQIAGAKAIPITQSPDNAATIAGENARAAAGRAVQLQVAGMGANGAISPALEAEAQMIADGRAAPPSGMAATRPAAAMLMQRVSQINPSYDATAYGAKIKAAKDFTSGNQGNAMRSFAVAGQHLDQLGKLVDALDNGNNQTVNQIGNAISSWNGNTPVTNFDAAKDVVSKEVIKAIVGSGSGGVAERGELAQLMSNAKSPQQLKGIIKQYTSLMGAQHEALLAQRRAAGIADSTLPNYGDAPAAASTAPAGWSYLGIAPGGK